MESSPFPDCKIDDYTFMDSIEGRQPCTKCGKSRKYYCYNCFLPLPAVKDRIPKVKLPLKVDIIKHPNEVDGKSTAAHAAVIAPDDVTVYMFPCIPDYKEKDKVLLVFPCEESLTFEQYTEQFCHEGEDEKDEEVKEEVEKEEQEKEEEEQEEDVCGTGASAGTSAANANNKRPLDGAVTPGEAVKRVCGAPRRRSEEPGPTDGYGDEAKARDDKKPKCPFERVVFIDSTWYQVKRISTDERLAGLQRIELKSQTTKFWRHQKDKPDTYLATIEAIYYFICEYHEHFVREKLSGQYDNLLFFFCFMYDKIKHLYDGGKKLKAYKKNS